MLAKLERCLYALTAMLVLWAVLVAVTPAVAQAQEPAPTKDTKDTNPNTAESIVVSPGDSLWSISAEWLGPKATPQQVAIGVERIYELNQERIGGDPNLILVGQRLSLPAVSEPSRAEASGRTASPPTREATKPREASTREPGPEKALGASKTPRNTQAKQEAKQVGLPEMPTKQPAPNVNSPTTTDAPSPVESFARSARSLFSSATSALVGLFGQDESLLENRKVLGVGIIALTLLVAGLIAWRMPLKRDVGEFEVWRLPRGYVSHYAQVARPVSRDSGGGEAPAAPAVENGLDGSAADDAAGTIEAAQRRRHRGLREQEGDTARLPHTGLATGAHDPQIIRHLRRARTPTPGRTVARSPRLRQRSLSQKGGRL